MAEHEEISTEDQIKAQENLDLFIIEKKIPKELVENIEKLVKLLHNEAEHIIAQIREQATVYGIGQEVLYDVYKLTLKKLGYSRSGVYYKLKMITEKQRPKQEARPSSTGLDDANNLHEQSPSNVEQEVEEITTKTPTNVTEENIIEETQNARSESKIETEVMASMGSSGKEMVWRAEVPVQTVKAVTIKEDDEKMELTKQLEAALADKEKILRERHELEDENRELSDQLEELKKKGSASDGGPPPGFVMMKISEVEDLRKDFEVVRTERDEFKEIAAKKNLVEATKLMPKPGEIRMKPWDFNDIVQRAAMYRQEIRIEHDGLKAIKLVRITGGERK